MSNGNGLALSPGDYGPVAGQLAVILELGVHLEFNLFAGSDLEGGLLRGAAGCLLGIA